MTITDLWRVHKEKGGRVSRELSEAQRSRERMLGLEGVVGKGREQTVASRQPCSGELSYPSPSTAERPRAASEQRHVGRLEDVSTLWELVEGWPVVFTSPGEPLMGVSPVNHDSREAQRKFWT